MLREIIKKFVDNYVPKNFKKYFRFFRYETAQTEHSHPNQILKIEERNGALSLYFRTNPNKEEQKQIRAFRHQQILQRLVKDCKIWGGPTSHLSKALHDYYHTNLDKDVKLDHEHLRKYFYYDDALYSDTLVKLTPKDFKCVMEKMNTICDADQHCLISENDSKQAFLEYKKYYKNPKENGEFLKKDYQTDLKKREASINENTEIIYQYTCDVAVKGFKAFSYSFLMQLLDHLIKPMLIEKKFISGADENPLLIEFGKFFIRFFVTFSLLNSLADQVLYRIVNPFMKGLIAQLPPEDQEVFLFVNESLLNFVSVMALLRPEDLLEFGVDSLSAVSGQAMAQSFITKFGKFKIEPAVRNPLNESEAAVVQPTRLRQRHVGT